jgi:hypothetical protein
MGFIPKHSGTAALAALFFLGSSPSVFAQFRTAPADAGNLPSPQMQVVSQAAAPGGSGFYPYYPPYYNYMGPYGSYLSGASDVISSQANFLVSKAQANVIQQQAEQARVDTRRKQYDQWKWERSQAQTLQDVRQDAYMQQLDRARTSPPLSEIWSGYSLNYLLSAIQHNESTDGVRGPTVPVDENAVKHINVTTGTTDTSSGSIGMLKNGKLEWTGALADERFGELRGRIDQLVTDAVNQVKTGGPANAATINSLKQEVTQLRADVRAQVAEISSGDYTRAVAFINELRNAVGQLSSPNAGEYLGGSLQPRGSTIGELVDQMTQKGMKFAPATPGSENYYSALYQAFLAYDAGLGRLARR